MKVGDKVRVKKTTINGSIVERRVDQNDNMQYRVSFDEEGETHERWFNEDQLMDEQGARR